MVQAFRLDEANREVKQETGEGSAVIVV